MLLKKNYMKQEANCMLRTTYVSTRWCNDLSNHLLGTVWFGFDVVDTVDSVTKRSDGLRDGRSQL